MNGIGNRHTPKPLLFQAEITIGGGQWRIFCYQAKTDSYKDDGDDDDDEDDNNGNANDEDNVYPR